MMHKFKFFDGLDKNTFVLSARWEREAITDIRHYHNIDVEAELTRIMSEEIARGIDEDIIRTLTRRINGGDNHGIDYLNHWLRIGENRA